MECEKSILVRVKDLKKYFPIEKGIIFTHRVGAVKAVDGVTFEIIKGETFGLVGESGCGKSTTGRAILQLHRPTAGKVFFEEIELAGLEASQLRHLRQRMQMIFQDPYSSLNPRHSIGKIIGEPLKVHRVADGKVQEERVRELLSIVGLHPSHAKRFPHELSGGQRQRVGIARAIALQPSFIVCDEPISALDVSIQAQIVNLLQDLQERLGLTYLFIAHDLSMVRHISSRVAVMYLGKIMELADRDELFSNPMHPYTQSLISAVPVPQPRIEKQRKRIVLRGEVPNPSDPPQGCVFNTRCPLAIPMCHKIIPNYREISANHFAACHLLEPSVSNKALQGGAY